MKFDIVDSLSTLKIDNKIWIYIIIIIVLLYAISYKIQNDLVSYNEKEGLNVLSMLTCPFKILSNFSTCKYYFTLDIIFGMVWLIVYCFIFIFIFWPLYFTFLLLISLSIFPKKWKKYPNYVLITKQKFFLRIEQLMRLFSTQRFLYRNKSDMKKCYCAPYVKFTFFPLDKYSPFISTEDSKDKSSSNTYLYFVPVVILLLLYIVNLYFRQ